MRAALIVIIFLFISSCKENDLCTGEYVDYKYYKLNSDTVLIPYDGTDTIRMEIRDNDSSIMDTVDFISGKKSYYIANIQGDPCAGNAQCEGYSLTFRSETWPDSIIFRAQQENAYTTFYFNYGNLIYRINGNQLSYANSTQLLAGKPYQNVVTAFDYRNTPEKERAKYVLLANKQNGLIYFKPYLLGTFTLIQ